MNEKLEIKNLTPVIATISAGKTSFLNAVYNIKFLEVSRQIGTKFVNIIRYNPKVGKIPLFYHLIVKKNYKDYDFYKDKKTEVKGSENIAKKNAEINAELKQKKDFRFEDIFYMTEVGEVSLIKDEKYLENYDLVDIPGLSEYLPTKENNLSDTSDTLKKVQNYLDLKRKESEENGLLKTNKTKEINYLTGIFTIIKNKVNNGIIIFDATNLGREENFEIIKKFHSIINRPIENFLILLNKIDERKDIKADIKTLETNIERFDPAGKYFYYTRNTLLPCSTYSLRNEVNMEKNFKYLMCYYFYNYKLKIKKEDETFLDYLINVLIYLNDESNSYDKLEVIEKIEQFLNSKNLNDIIEEIKNSIIAIKKICQKYNYLKIGIINEDNFNEKGIKDFLSKMKEDISDSDSDEDDISSKKKKKNDDIIIRDLSPEIILIYFYHFYKEKINIPPISIGNKKIIDYFTMKNMEKIHKSDENNFYKNRTIKYLENTLQDLKIFYEGYKKKYILQSTDKPRKYSFRNRGLETNLNLISQKLEKFKYFYLPFVGMNNSGKSTIINDLIGYELLPIGQDATTKKGILIKYWDRDYPKINKVKFEFNSGKYYFTNEAFLGKGMEDVKKILKNINTNFSDKKDNFFYEVYTKIKFLDENKFSQKLKDKICFIDLPGYVTKYEFAKKEIHSQIIQCAELVIFVFEILKKGNNRESLENIIDELKNIFKTKGSQTNASLQHRILFINNIFENEDIKKDFQKTNKDFENEISQLKIKAKNEIMDIFGKTFNSPKVCVINAQNYFDYAQNINKFQQIEEFLKYEKMKFNRQNENFYKGEISAKGIQKNFIKYLMAILKDEFEKANNSSILSEEKLEKEDENISKKELEKIEEIANNYFGISKESKKFKKIISIVSKINNIKTLYKFSINLNNSYYERFSKDIMDFILYGEKIKNKNLIEDLEFILNQLNTIFFQQYKGEMPKLLKLENTEPKFEKMKFDYEKDIYELVEEMNNALEKDKNNFVNSLKKSLFNLKQNLKTEKHNYNQKQKVEKTDNSFFGWLKSVVNNALNDYNWMVSNEWVEVKDRIKTTFENEADNFIKEFKECSNKYSIIVDKYYTKIENIFYDILNLFDDEQLPKDWVDELEKYYQKNKYQDFKTYVKKNIDNYNEKSLENVLEDIKLEILEGAEECTYFKNSKSFFDFIRTSLRNSQNLFTIIDYICDKSGKKFSFFIRNIENYLNDYPETLKNNIDSLVNETENYFDDLIEKEYGIIKEKNKENESKKNIYLKEMNKYFLEKSKWKKTCEEYQKIGKDLGIYVDEIKEYLYEDVETILSGNKENKIENIFEQENNAKKGYESQKLKIENKNYNIYPSNTNNANYSIHYQNNVTTTSSKANINFNEIKSNQPIIANTSNPIDKNQKNNDNYYSKNEKTTYVRKFTNIQQKNINTNYLNNYKEGIRNDIHMTNVQPENINNSNNNNIIVTTTTVRRFRNNNSSKTVKNNLTNKQEFNGKVETKDYRYNKYKGTGYQYEFGEDHYY